MSKDEFAIQIISGEISRVHSNPLLIRGNGCAACHILFTLSKEMQISEQDASDLLSSVLFSNSELNDSFIEMVEYTHMIKRNSGSVFAIKTREAKDRYINSNFKNTLAELHGDLVNYGPEIVIRKLLLSLISLEIAKSIGTDHHAAMEELYYFMRKNDEQTNGNLVEFMRQLEKRIIKE